MPLPVTVNNYSMQIDYDVSNNPIYVGFSPPPAGTANATWLIQKITFDASNNPTAVQYPNGNPSFIYVWNDRTGYSYS